MYFKGLIFSALFLLVNALNSQRMPLSIEKDSLFIESSTSHQLYFNYKVNKNQTLYHISKSFDVTLDSLKSFNKELQMLGLRENSLLKIPIQKTKIILDTKNGLNSSVGLYYKIKPGENLYHISKRKFNIYIEKIIQLNKLEKTTIREGTVLLLGYYQLDCSAPVEETPALKTFPTKPVGEIAPIKFTMESRGVAICEYYQMGTGRLFALHNTALMDSYIEIENPILKRKIYAKIIGRIPPIYERDIQLIVSPEVARLLGAVDKRFFVSLRYR